MQLKINDDFHVETDNFNFILKRKLLRKSRDGSGFTVDWSETYYPTLEQLFNAFINKSLLDYNTGEPNEFAEIIDFLKTLRVDVKTFAESAGCKNVIKHIATIRQGGVPEEVAVPVRAKRGRPPGTKPKGRTY